MCLEHTWIFLTESCEWLHHISSCGVLRSGRGKRLLSVTAASGWFPVTHGGEVQLMWSSKGWLQSPVSMILQKPWTRSVATAEYVTLTKGKLLVGPLSMRQMVLHSRAQRRVKSEVVTVIRSRTSELTQCVLHRHSVISKQLFARHIQDIYKTYIGAQTMK